MTWTPLSRSKVNLEGAGHIVAASHTACYCDFGGNPGRYIRVESRLQLGGHCHVLHGKMSSQAFV